MIDNADCEGIASLVGMPDLSSSSAIAVRPHPHLYEINTWAWLEELSAKLGRKITLRDVPDSQWDEFSLLGFDLIWLMGIWERSPVGRRFFQTDAASFSAFDQALPGWKLSDVVGSPYSVRRYQPDPRIGTWADLDLAREKLRARRIGLILDFVPNHSAPDHPWTSAHPEYYIRGTLEDFRRDPNAFFLLDSPPEPTLIAHGRDPYFPPWRDVVQFNYFEPAARAAMLRELREIAKHCDGVRCDMAMLVFNSVFAKTWFSFLQGHKPPASEYWSEAIAAVPNFMWLAEVYWNCEGQCHDLGFNFTYDKGFYDALKEGQIAEIQERLDAPLNVQSGSARFLENHDEARSATVFGAAKREAVVALISTLPGMRFYHHGQLDGRKIQLPMPLAFASPETPDMETRAFYERILKLANESIFHTGAWKLLEVSSAGDGSFRNLITYQWLAEDGHKAVIVNLANSVSQARIRFGGEISSGQKYFLLDQLHDVRYPRDGQEISEQGLYVRLDPYRAHLFDITPA